MTEWLSCLNAQRPTIGIYIYIYNIISFTLLLFCIYNDCKVLMGISANDPEKPLTTPKRIGPNPLDQFLNDDD